jgi:hypothetical protein
MARDDDDGGGGGDSDSEEERNQAGGGGGGGGGGGAGRSIDRGALLRWRGLQTILNEGEAYVDVLEAERLKLLVTKRCNAPGHQPEMSCTHCGLINLPSKGGAFFATQLMWVSAQVANLYLL